MKLAREAAYTPAQLEAYDQYWDTVSRERTLMSGARQEGREEERAAMVAEMWAQGLPETTIEKILRNLGK